MEKGVPEITPDIEQKIKEELIRQYEDQYGVKITIVKDKVPLEPA